MMTAIALTIAGSDSSGGAGIQADLKTFAALGVYGASVVTALTAQNTTGVTAVHEAPPEFVAAQLDAVFSDLDVAAVKIGMLGGAAVIEAVAAGLEKRRPRWIIIDPVMVAKGGDRLLADDAVAALRETLIPLAHLITPNLPEAGVLLDEPAARDRQGMQVQAERLLRLGPQAVLLKGGHLAGDTSPDLLHDGRDATWLEAARHETRNTHGTGCTLSSAIAAQLALGQSLADAVSAAKTYLGRAIAGADQVPVGHGHGPVHHFHRLWPMLQKDTKETGR
ncbi:MAG: bifunctional hydroxymethylpyrimidine kinase/phosphomethylpyrimidine kinase [Hyphomicrobiales bacterium]